MQLDTKDQLLPTGAFQLRFGFLPVTLCNFRPNNGRDLICNFMLVGLKHELFLFYVCARRVGVVDQDSWNTYVPYNAVTVNRKFFGCGLCCDIIYGESHVLFVFFCQESSGAKIVKKLSEN